MQGSILNTLQKAITGKAGFNETLGMDMAFIIREAKLIGKVDTRQITQTFQTWPKLKLAV